jgi:hypothetical protein
VFEQTRSALYSDCCTDVLAISRYCSCFNRIEELEQRLVQAVGDAKEANDLRYAVDTVLLYDDTKSHPICDSTNAC